MLISIRCFRKENDYNARLSGDNSNPEVEPNPHDRIEMRRTVAVEDNESSFINWHNRFDATRTHPVTCESSSDTACCAFWPH